MGERRRSNGKVRGRRGVALVVATLGVLVLPAPAARADICAVLNWCETVGRQVDHAQQEAAYLQQEAWEAAANVVPTADWAYETAKATADELYACVVHQTCVSPTP